MLTHFIRYTATSLIVVLLQACGGGSTSSGPTATVSGVSNPTATVAGVAATGAAIDGTVTLKDSTGITRSTVISLPSGAFSMDVSGLTPPYFLKATNNAGTLALYSISTGSGTFNINPLSNLVVVAAAMSIDPLAKTPDAAFNNPANFSTLTAAKIQAATDIVMAQMPPAFKTALADYGVSNVNPLTDSYQIGNGLDKVFDSFVVTLNTATGKVQESQVAGNLASSGTTGITLSGANAGNYSFVTVPETLATTGGGVTSGGITSGGVIGISGTVCGQTTTGNGSITTPPAGTLIITAIPACKSYDGQTYSGGNGVTYSGFLNGDTSTVLGGTLTYGGTSQAARNAGTYTITPGGLTSSNYNIIYVDSTLTVNPVTLTLTRINNTSKIYDGSTSATLSTTAFTFSGPIGGDTITLSGANAGAVSGGGTYTIDGGNAANYGLTGTTTSVPTITIGRATLSTGP